ncbi:MAG: group II intron reverse transcriptase/maturase [Candidatus Thiodiazotropha endolucinida]
MNGAKPFTIAKSLVWEAYKRVKANRGAAGVDAQSLQQFEQRLGPNLYRIWNRLSSGSYFPPAVKGVAIPKKSGGERILGIPTVSDRVAQTVVKMVFEPLVEPIFHENSYGYRPGRSAHDALAIVRRRCWEYDWVIEFDIKGLFDHIDHELLMRAVRHHCQIPWVVLYIERWLKAPMVGADGETQQRDKGTPQGGVISPVLANLFLHYTLDRWIRHHLCSVRLCRYADDGVIHCKSERQAHWVLAQISERLAACGLQIHPEKTRIVYCKDVNRREEHENIEFTFLGYSFRPRKAVDKYGRVYPNFSPAASPVVLKNMRQTIRSWHLQLKCDKSLHDLSRMFNPALRGWWQYYGRFNRSVLRRIGIHLDGYLVRWLMRKYKYFAGHKTRAWRYLDVLKSRYPYAFIHWTEQRNGRMMGAV